MPVAKTYQHFCPIARSLELIGEKWSLLVVRDLLRGPLRFTDLLRYVGGITPKWLTARLRDLERAGIVVREPGRGREVWYRLTPRGYDLGPVMEALAAWGIDHAMRSPLPGEVLFPEQTLSAVAAYLNQRQLNPSAPRKWQFRFDERGPLELRFDGVRWSSGSSDGLADVTVTASPTHWIAFLLAMRAGRAPEHGLVQIDGRAAIVREFLGLIGQKGASPRSSERRRVLARARR